MSDNTEVAFTSASDVAKQLITLATGVLALTITFAKDITNNTEVHKPLLILAWVGYLASVLGGVWTLMALTGSLGKGEQSIYGWNVRIPAISQILLFVGATVLIIVYAALSIGVEPPPPKT